MVQATQRPTPAEILNNLQYAIGSVEYHPIARQVVITDGVKYLADAARCYWLMDIIASYQKGLIRRGHVFQVWRMKCHIDEQGGRYAQIYCDDGNGRKLRHQKVERTDFPLDEIKLYAEWNTVRVTIMLPQER